MQEFIGEHLIPGQLGHVAVVSTFLFSLLASFSYYKSHTDVLAQKQWVNLGKISSVVSIITTLLIGVFLYHIILNHYFEYYYAWSHSSLSLPKHFIISCFWEGQEGSFWLWMFWQSVAMTILLLRNKKTPALALSLISLSQVFLCSMILGIKILDIQIGSSPFILLRNAIEGPIFSRPDYLSLIQDGKGLNPLLQSYWMVIHPPILFLGFSSTIVPLAYLFQGVIQKNILGVLPNIKKWILFAFISLGTGILLGSFWAYEALNFGGYWAWDPVENASIVPWLTLIVSIHLIIVFKKMGGYPTLTAFFIAISFLLVLYASFLTRSGILGESSAHAFTDLGLSGQLLSYLFFFFLIAVFVVVKTQKLYAHSEEKFFTREFWMICGGIITALSALQIIATTSIPVFNKIFGSSLAPPVEIMEHYNKWQYIFVLLMTILMGLGMLSRFKTQGLKVLLKKSVNYFLISILLTVILVWYLDLKDYHLFVFLILFCWFTFLINLSILVKNIFNKKMSGATLSHTGFTLMLVGIVISGVQQKVLSINMRGIDYGEEFRKNNNQGENVLLFKNEPYKMGDYLLTYKKDSVNVPNTFYEVKFQKYKDNKVIEEFMLLPRAQNNPKMGLIASPDLSSTFFDNLYAHVSMVPIVENEEEVIYANPITITLSIGDEANVLEHNIKLLSIDSTQEAKNLTLEGDNKLLTLNFKIKSIDGSEYDFSSKVLVFKKNYISIKNIFEPLKWKWNVFDYSAHTQTAQFYIYPPRTDHKKYIVLKVILFPFINLYWVGAILILVGGGVSWWKKKKEKLGQNKS